VAARTNEKIQDLFPEPPPSHTKLILASALYFNGAWLQPFLAEATRKAPFRVTPDETTTVSMMTREGHMPYARSKLLDCAVVGLPYKTHNNTAQVKDRKFINTHVTLH
jgi:serpin B